MIIKYTSKQLFFSTFWRPLQFLLALAYGVCVHVVRGRSMMLQDRLERRLVGCTRTAAVQDTYVRVF